MAVNKQKTTPSIASSSSSSSARGMGVLRAHDWTSPDWNWGYAEGTAHDLAAELRGKLSVKKEDLEDRRLAWVLDPATPVDDLLLALALAIQARGANAENFAGFLTKLADTEYGDSISPSSQSSIEAALSEAVITFDNEPPKDSPDGVMLKTFYEKLSEGIYEGSPSPSFRKSLIISCATMRFVGLAC
ncbi:hypothetical protein TrST_g11189 [Triparma strigata]|uniref:Uncharacterized protein n=1 Tax=Triparma strigata TaxID=1606541 RepID=A0A9W7BIK1_9STRA|nr:hypothetical protein TrST_g11189 [Triparma strigata]